MQLYLSSSFNTKIKQKKALITKLLYKRHLYNSCQRMIFGQHFRRLQILGPLLPDTKREL